MTAFRVPARPTPTRRLRSSYHGWPFRIAVVAALIMVAVAGPLRAPSHAVDGTQSTDVVGSVRLFDSGEFVGGGALVDRNWVIVPSHLVQRSGIPQAYSIRFGVLTNADDGSDTSNRRRIDRIVFAPQGGLVMMHFADPVPADTAIPPLATDAPARFTPAYFFGWGGAGANAGTRLNAQVTVVFDPVATANAAEMRTDIAGFAEAFPPSIEPMVVPAATQPGDAGSLIFSETGFLIGIHTLTGNYFHVSQRNQSIHEWTAGYDQPMWLYRQWVRDTINGAGSSGTAAPGGSNRRRLTDTTSGDLPMTLPPRTSSCVPHLGSCTATPPPWAQGVLLGAGNFRGTAQARCATTTHDTCSFDGVTTAPGASTRMRLGTTTAPNAPGTREVIAWCQTTTPFPDANSPTRQVLRVSFTNADPDDTPTGYGWWDITPDQIGTGNGQTLLDPGPLAPC